MTPEDVEVWLGRIREHVKAGDNEAAHMAEDDMRAGVLNAIAHGSTDDPVHLARLALSSSDIKFTRWYA